MELQFLSFPVLFGFLLFLFMVFITGKRSISAPKLPPGPWKLPLVGNMHQLGGSLLHHCLRDLSMKHGPLMHLQLGQVSSIVISSPEIAKEIMRTHDIIFAQRPKLIATRVVTYDCTDIAFAPYGDYWRQLRKICLLELLSGKRVQCFRSIREEEVLNLIREISFNAGVLVNLSEKIFSLAYGITAKAAFGEKCKDQEAFISAVTDIVKLYGDFNLADMFPSVKFIPLITGMERRIEKLQQKADRILENIINDRKNKSETTAKNDNGESEEALVDVLLKFQQHGGLEIPLTRDNIKAVISDIFSAGSDTSSTTVEWAMSEMLKNPTIMKKAQAEVRQVFRGSVDETGLPELVYLKAVIKETLRLHPPAPLLLPRESGESCEINGFYIPVKTRVIINFWAIGRDPRYWREAERFYPERFLDSSIDYKGTDFEYIPFGAGRRICPGILFGMANIELTIAQLLYHFDWELPNGRKLEDLDMTEEFALTVRRKNELQLIPIPYHFSAC